MKSYLKNPSSLSPGDYVNLLYGLAIIYELVDCGRRNSDVMCENVQPNGKRSFLLICLGCEFPKIKATCH